MKIPLIIVFFILFSFSKTSDLLDSESIWKKVHEHIDNETIDFNYHYFTFDLKDYANLSKDITKKNAFIQKQRHLYLSYNIPNYLFIVDDFDIDKESIETVSSNLVSYISKDYDIDTSKSIVIFIAIDRRKTRIQIGTKLNDLITDSDCEKTINDMTYYMRNERYYDAFCEALDDIDYYYKLRSSSTDSTTSETHYFGPILVAILFIGLLVVIIFLYRKYGCSGHYSDDELYSTFNEPNRYSNLNNNLNNNNNSNIGEFLQSDGGYHKSAGDSSSGGGGGSHGGGHTGGATGGW